MPDFRVKLGANDLNCVDVPLNPTHSLLTLAEQCCSDVCNSLTVLHNTSRKSTAESLS